MSTIPLTIGDFFEGHPSSEVLSKAVEPEKQQKIRAILKETPDLSWDSIGKEFGSAYRSILDINIFDVFCGGWAKVKELQAFADQRKHPPEEISLVPLSEHKISSKHQPRIEILFGGKKLFELKFEVLLKLKLEFFILKIQGGCIHEISAGSFTIAGMIKCGGQRLVEKKSPTYKLPANRALKECFKIPGYSGSQNS